VLEVVEDAAEVPVGVPRPLIFLAEPMLETWVCDVCVVCVCVCVCLCVCVCVCVQVYLCVLHVCVCFIACESQCCVSACACV